MTPNKAYWFVLNNPDCDIGKYQKIACESPGVACLFATCIPEANVEYCQVSACKNPVDAFYFIRGVWEADIEYCYNNSHAGCREELNNFILWQDV